eukprot:COSAG02_NODE_18716_length_923_cov_1.220874_1_plen_305_part_01
MIHRIARIVLMLSLASVQLQAEPTLQPQHVAPQGSSSSFPRTFYVHGRTHVAIPEEQRCIMERHGYTIEIHDAQEALNARDFAKQAFMLMKAGDHAWTNEPAKAADLYERSASAIESLGIHDSAENMTDSFHQLRRHYLATSNTQTHLEQKNLTVERKLALDVLNELEVWILIKVKSFSDALCAADRARVPHLTDKFFKHSEHVPLRQWEYPSEPFKNTQKLASDLTADLVYYYLHKRRAVIYIWTMSPDGQTTFIEQSTLAVLGSQSLEGLVATFSHLRARGGPSPARDLVKPASDSGTEGRPA